MSQGDCSAEGRVYVFVPLHENRVTVCPERMGALGGQVNMWDASKVV